MDKIIPYFFVSNGKMECEQPASYTVFCREQAKLELLLL